ncbi:S8 family serine peptidase [Krasilnikovia sp. MM14-A1004]|uniref:S8 family serine peptidase n=1 Tax=Krasilnikovia sp. MM14-A1004 TaxID=3373541 RepID=UPI00399CFBE2
MSITRFAMAAGLATAAVVAATAGPALAGAPTAPTGTVLAAEAGEAISNSYIVVLKPDSAAADQVTSASQQLGRRYGGEVQDNYLTAVRGFHIRMTAAQAARLAADPSVQYIEQDAKISLADTQTDPAWGLDRIDQRALPLSQSYTFQSASNVTAYVLDTGIRLSHAELGGRARNGWDFIDGDPVAQDCNGHGTHVAGTIGGATAGVAKDVQLVGVRVLDCNGSGSYSAIIAGVDWVTAHAVKPAVANMSIGGSGSTALNNAVANSIAAGITYAVAAGNNNADACQYSPASAPAAITVGATGSDDARAWFSNYGTCVDLFAPGVGITSAWYTSDTAMADLSGTSMASPHVAGAAALTLAAHPTWTPARVRDALVGTATTNAVTGAGTGSPNRLLYTGPDTPVVAKTPTPTASTPKAPLCGPFTNASRVAVKGGQTVRRVRVISTCAGLASRTSSVTVRMRGGYRGRPVAVLVTPVGRTRVLTAATSTVRGGEVVTTYRLNLSSYRRNGTWTLRITNPRGARTGYVDSWTLAL